MTLIPPTPKETLIVHQALDWLEADPRVMFCMRINSGAMRDSAGRFVRFYQLFKLGARAAERRRLDIVEMLLMSNRKSIKNPHYGFPDLLGMLTDGRLFVFEAKKPGWTRPTDDRERLQAFVLELVREAGGVAGFITDWRDLARHFEEAG